MCPSKISALVDTGPVINLIRRDLVDPHFFQASSKPVKMAAANSTRLCGGSHEVATILSMHGIEVDTQEKVDIRVPFVAYDAAIKHDNILSYAWLAAMEQGGSGEGGP